MQNHPFWTENVEARSVHKARGGITEDIEPTISTLKYLYSVILLRSIYNKTKMYAGPITYDVGDVENGSYLTIG